MKLLNWFKKVLNGRFTRKEYLNAYLYLIGVFVIATLAFGFLEKNKILESLDALNTRDVFLSIDSILAYAVKTLILISTFIFDTRRIREILDSKPEHEIFFSSIILSVLIIAFPKFLIIKFLLLFFPKKGASNSTFYKTYFEKWIEICSSLFVKK